MNTVLTFFNGFLQYKRGKETGLAGLVGIILFVLAIYRWDITYPILDSLGIVNFFDNLGLIYEGESGTTLVVIMMFLTRAAFIIMIFMAIAMTLVLFLLIIGTSEFGQKIIGFLIIIVMTPFLVIWMLGYYLFYSMGFRTKKDKADEEYEKWHIDTFGDHSEEYKEEKVRQEETKLSGIDLLKKYCEVYFPNEAMEFINNLPMAGDTLFIIGETFSKDLYLIMPDPLLKYRLKMDNRHKRTTYTKVKVIPLMVENVVGLNKDRTNIMQYSPDKMIITKKKIDGYEHLNPNTPYEYLSDMEFFEFKAMYLPDKNLKDIGHYISSFGNSNDYRKYREEKVPQYFKEKNHLISFLYQDITNEKYQEVVSDLKEFDSPNEDIVKMINDSQQILGVKKNE